MKKEIQIAFWVLLGMLVAVPVLAQTQTYCSDVGGNIACTSYDNGGSSQTYCSSIAGSLTCTTYNNDNYNRVQIERNYEAGEVIGTALGNVITAAIQAHNARKQARQEWDQFVQDILAKTELQCETDPNIHDESGAVGCRTFMFAFNQFVHKHRKDFVVDARNVSLLSDAIDKIPDEQLPASFSLVTEQTVEIAFEYVDKKQLDKKPRWASGKDVF
ncbi:MAG: hypothetical protein ACLQVG_02145 [Terriglobia bacterium]